MHPNAVLSPTSSSYLHRSSICVCMPVDACALSEGVWLILLACVHFRARNATDSPPPSLHPPRSYREEVLAYDTFFFSKRFLFDVLGIPILFFLLTALRLLYLVVWPAPEEERGRMSRARSTQ